jgi:hypothetical protein
LAVYTPRFLKIGFGPRFPRQFVHGNDFFLEGLAGNEIFTQALKSIRVPFKTPRNELLKNAE